MDTDNIPVGYFDALRELKQDWQSWEEQERLAQRLPYIQKEAVARILIEAENFVLHSNNENYERLVNAVLHGQAVGALRGQ